MRQEVKDQLARAMFTVLRNSQAIPNAAALSERLVNAAELIIDMSTEESGIAPVPPDLRDDPTAFDHRKLEVRSDIPEVPVRQKEALPPSNPAAVSSAPPARTIVMPGDKEFNAPVDADPRKVAIARRGGGRPVAKKDKFERPVWDAGELIDQILRNTPEEIYFTPKGMEGIVELKAIRNTGNKPEIGVDLIYRHPSMADASGQGVQHTDGVPDTPVSIDLTARFFFSLYQHEFDFDTIVELCTRQLVGLYQSRSDETEPHSSGAPPSLTSAGLRFDAAHLPMGDSHGEQWDKGMRQISDPFATRGGDRILRDSIQRVRDTNKQYGNK